MQRWKGLANVCSGIFKPQELHDQVNKTKQKKNVISRERSGSHFLRKRLKYYSLKTKFGVLSRPTLTWHKLGLHSHWNSCACKLPARLCITHNFCYSYGAHYFVITCLLLRGDSQKRYYRRRHCKYGILDSIFVPINHFTANTSTQASLFYPHLTCTQGCWGAAAYHSCLKAQGEHANTTQGGPEWEFNPQLSYCEVCQPSLLLQSQTQEMTKWY